MLTSCMRGTGTVLDAGEGTDGIHATGLSRPDSPNASGTVGGGQTCRAWNIVKRKAGLATFGTELGGGWGDERPCQRGQGEILHAGGGPLAARWCTGGTACLRGCSEGRREDRRGQQMRSQHAGGVLEASAEKGMTVRRRRNPSLFFRSFLSKLLFQWFFFWFHEQK